MFAETRFIKCLLLLVYKIIADMRFIKCLLILAQSPTFISNLLRQYLYVVPLNQMVCLSAVLGHAHVPLWQVSVSWLPSRVNETAHPTDVVQDSPYTAVKQQQNQKQKNLHISKEVGH